VEAFQLGSERLHRELRISIAHPSSGAGGKPIAAYLLDPSFNFSAAVAAAAFLGNFARMVGARWPDVAIAGIGYETDDPREIMTRRALDLTPTDHGAPAGVQLPPLSFGGAASFLAALHEEVMPAVEDRLGARPSARVLAGHSFGGLFGLYTLFHQPRLFDGYLLVSPSIWWDDRIAFRYERTSREANPSLPARLFLAVGEKEQSPGGGWRNEGFSDDAIAKLQQLHNFRELVATLERRAHDGLRMQSAVVPDEYHLTVFPAAFTHGLRWMVEELG
jgi:predicted alpha/beta superfamily hydrolase